MYTLEMMRHDSRRALREYRERKAAKQRAIIDLRTPTRLVQIAAAIALPVLVTQSIA